MFARCARPVTPSSALRVRSSLSAARSTRPSPASARPLTRVSIRAPQTCQRSLFTFTGPIRAEQAEHKPDISDPVQSRIAEDIKRDKVVLYMKGTPEQPMCGYSRLVCQILQQEKVPFSAFNVLEDPNLREGIKKFTGWPTIPQVFLVGEFVGGADVMKDLYQSGELTDMLLKAGLQPESAKP